MMMMQNTIQLETARWGASVITPEERQEIIDAAVEKALLMLPTVVGNLMAQQATQSKMVSQFYKDHPDFAKHKDIVAACIEQVDGHNPLLLFDEKLAKAVPMIQQRIKDMSVANTTIVNTKADRTFSGPLEAKRPDYNGEF
jgi:hypothetical protein